MQPDWCLPKPSQSLSQLSLVGTLILYVFMCPLVSKWLYDRVLYCDLGKTAFNYQDAEVEGVHAENCYFRNIDGALLHGQFFKKPDATMVTIINHGQGGNLTAAYATTTMMIACNSSAFVYDYQGYGHSTGKPNLNGICHDGSSAYQYVRQALHFKPSQIIEFGESLGSGVAANVAKDHPCAGVMLFAPYASLLRTAREHFWFLNLYPDWLFPYKDIETLSFVRQEHPPILMLHGTQDPVISCRQAEDIARSAVDPLTFVEYSSCGHGQFFGRRTTETLHRVRDFVDKLQHSLVATSGK